MNVDLKDAYLYAFKIASENPTYTPQLLQQMSALVMRRTGSEYSTIAGHFDSSKGEFRLCNVRTFGQKVQKWNGVLNVLGKGQNKASGIANRQTEYAGCPQGSS